MVTDQQVQDKINKKIFISGECWVWLGSINKVGRPQITFDHRQKEEGKMLTYFPHEWLYVNKYGDFDVRYLDSTCGNLRCVNPDHQAPRTLENMLFMKLAKDEVTGCWNWTGGLFDSGYGRVTKNGKNALAHRVSYAHFFGSIPEGLQVCHKCNNKRCINPDHLYVGTHNDNMRDVTLTDVHKGENNAKALLTQSQVLEIKAHIRERKIVYRKIAEMYGVSRQAIKDIASGRTWGWLE